MAEPTDGEAIMSAFEVVFDRHFDAVFRYLRRRVGRQRAEELAWRVGDTIPLGGRTLRIVAVRDDDADQPPRLVVEDTPQ